MVLESFDFMTFFLMVKPLVFFIGGVAIYAVFVFNFYKFLAKRDVFSLNLKKYNKSSHPVLNKFFGFIFYCLEYVIFFPVLVFFWFIVLALFLTFLSEAHSMENILLISMALVGAVRVICYYSEDLAKDLAKMLPFALLGVFLLDLNFFSFSEALVKVGEVRNLIYVLFYYLVFIILMEFILRIGHFVYLNVFGREDVLGFD